MNLTINSLSSVDRAYGLSSQNKNSKKENVSFEGLNISSKQVKNAAVGFALFSASVLGLSACKSNSSEKSKEAANTEYVAPVQDGEEISFEDRINEYMAKDKKVVDVNIRAGRDYSYVYPLIKYEGSGYDKSGKLIRRAEIWDHGANGPELEPPSPRYYPREDYQWRQYLPDRTIIVDSFPGEPAEYVRIEYNKPAKYDGKSWFKVSEKTSNKFTNEQHDIYTKRVIYEKGKNQENEQGNGRIYSNYCVCELDYDTSGKLRRKVVTHKKGEEIWAGDGEFVYSKDFQSCTSIYDKDGKLLEKRVLVPDKNKRSYNGYNSYLILDEKKSILPKDISKSDE